MRTSESRADSGQVLLITLLVLSVAVTIALSLIGRGTMDANMSANLEESARAFNAAEAGIEDALKSGIGTQGAQVAFGPKQKTGLFARILKLLGFK